MNVQICFKPSHSLALGIDVDITTHSELYECVAKQLMKFPVPNDIDVTFSGAVVGAIGYTVIKKEDSYFVTQNYYQIDTNELSDVKYPTRYLTCIEAAKDDGSSSNKYKFYQLEDSGISEDKPIIATYGRIGESGSGRFRPRTSKYPKEMYWIKYYEKLSKGYVDNTEAYINVVEDVKVAEETTATIDSNSVAQKLWNELQAYAKGVIKNNISASVTKITAKMAENSRKLLNELLELSEDEDTEVIEFNSKLMELLMIAPRSVNKVADLLAVVPNDPTGKLPDFQKVLLREEVIVQSMESVVAANQAAAHPIESGEDEFAKNGIHVTLASPEDTKMCLDMLQPTQRKDATGIVYDIHHGTAERIQKQFMKDWNASEDDLKLFFHGTANGNLLSIIVTRPTSKRRAAFGRAFGDFVYTALDSDKSDGYTNGGRWHGGQREKRFLLVFSGVYRPTDVASCGQYTEEYLKSHNATCLHYHAGVRGGCGFLRDEIMFPDDALAIRYLIELR